MTAQDIVAKLWNLCNVLRDDGVTYHQYVTELTYLLFLKMAKETGHEDRLPKGYRWDDLEKKNAVDRLEFYKLTLIHLGSHGSAITRQIFANAATVIRKPATLTTLVTEIDKLDWYDAKKEGMGDLYEGLLEKNANEKKSGAGQYFTPRVLIDVMVELMRPELDDTVCDPAAGTGGFLISANHYLRAKSDIMSLAPKAYDRYKHHTFYGMEFVQDAHRLALMNMMLHDLEAIDDDSGILFGDTLSNEGKALPSCSLVLSNPPFGTKKGGGLPTRDDLVHYTSNKQLAFLHIIYHRLLKPGGRAAIVLPDNVLFEAGIGKTLRRDLMEKCNLHTLLRLPTGIFYAQGVKTNVLFFTKPKDPKKDKGNTKKVWVYDLRSNMPQFGKRTLLTQEHFAEFIQCFGKKPDGTSKRSELPLPQGEGISQLPLPQGEGRGEGSDAFGRWRMFSRDYIATRDDSLDITWLKDDSETENGELPEPDLLARKALEELAGAMNELQAILVELGAEEEAEIAE